MYDWLPDYDTFTANFLLQLFGPTTIKHGDSAGIVLPVPDDVFSTDEFIRRVVTKTRKAQEHGFNRCRVTGCPVWLESSD